MDMDKLRLHQLKAVKALEYLANVCEANSIRYYLLAGSCLGAVRHRGFIPWDDDIDVGILDKDYEALENAIQVCLPDNIQWISNKTSDDYSRFFGALLDENGVALVDVFILVPLPKTESQKKHVWRTHHILSKIYIRKFGHKRFADESFSLYYISLIMSKLLRKKTIVRLAKWNAYRYKNSFTNDYLNVYSIYSYDKEAIKEKWLEPQSLVDFEGRKYTTVSDTHEYLTNLYGDYMTLPDSNNREMRHISVKYGRQKNGLQ